MREYKFRVWDTENKEMLKVQELDFEDTFYGGRLSIRTDQYNDYFDIEDMILMQYTGLKDRNGKEIYEGYIVYIMPEDERGIIRWDNETARYVVIHDNIISDFDNWYGKDLEVIGNEFDNPELLEEGE